jgi:hypothetical protein
MFDPEKRRTLKLLGATAAGVILHPALSTLSTSLTFSNAASQQRNIFGNRIARMRIANAGNWAGKKHTFKDIFDLISTWKLTHMNRYYSCPPPSLDHTITDGVGNRMLFKDFINESIAASNSPNSPVAISPRIPWDIVLGTESCLPPGGTGLEAFKETAKMIWEFQSHLTPPQTAISIDNAETDRLTPLTIQTISMYLRSLGFEHIAWGSSGNTDVSTPLESDWAMCLAYDYHTKKLLDTSPGGDCNLKVLQQQGWYLSYQAEIDFPYQMAYFFCHFGGKPSMKCPCLNSSGKAEIGLCNLRKANGTTTWDNVANAIEEIAKMQSSLGFSFVYPIIESNWDSTTFTTSSSGRYGGSSLAEVMYHFCQNYN